MSILEKRSIYREYIEHREKKAVFLRATAFFSSGAKERKGAFEAITTRKAT